MTVTDARACTTTANATVAEPIILTATAIVTDITCNGLSDGEILITPADGTAPYTYEWDNVLSTSNNPTGLDEGNYFVTVTDANGCTTTTSGTVTEPDIISASFVITNVSCIGDSDGEIDLSVSGGTVVADYTYLWNVGGEITQDITGQAIGIYTVDITDDNGCSISSSATISNPTPISATFSSTLPECYGDSTGVINISVVGGSLPYTFEWSNDSTTEDLTNVAAGIYDVTITDANGCELIESSLLQNPQQISLLLQPTNASCSGNIDAGIDLTVINGTWPYTYNWSNLALTEDLTGLNTGTYFVTVTDFNGCQKTGTTSVSSPQPISQILNVTSPSCNGNADGAINLIVYGGTPSYSYEWSNLEITQNISNLVAGHYIVTITDNNGCESIDSIDISDPELLSVTLVKSDISCFGEVDGTASLTVSGGTTPYAFAWTGGQATQNVSGLAEGTHYVTITDANLCELIDSAVIAEPTILDLTATISDVSCFGFNDGNIDITTLGGISPYTYAWSNSESTEDNAGLVSDSYSITITDANLCTLDSIFTVNQPSELDANFAILNVTCNGNADGAINMTISGGTTAYNIDWETLETTEDISGLIADTYTVDISDVNGCTLTDSVTITEPNILAVTVSTTDIICFGEIDGTASLSVTGGTTPYTYAWTGGQITQNISSLAEGVHYVTITDANLCELIDSAVIAEPNEMLISYSSSDISCYNDSDGGIDLNITNGIAPLAFAWSNDSTTEDLANIVAGIYHVTVTDFTGCTKDTSITISQPTELSVALSATNVDCNSGTDGAINATVSGGTTPYSFAWSNGTIFEDLTNIFAGTYVITVTDNNSCSKIESIQVTEPNAPTIVLSSSNADCGTANGSVWIESYNGFSEPVSISWNTSPVQTNDTVINLIAGIYQVVIEDVNGCSDSTSVTIDNTDGPTLDSLIQTNVSCYGGFDGTAEVIVSGGTSPYSYFWSSGEITSNISNIFAGNYSVTILDANSCQLIESVEITQQAAMNINYTITDVTCYGGNNGAISIAVSGGTSPYTYLWNNAETLDSIANLSADTYDVTVFDSNGCETGGSTTISEPEQIIISTSSTNATCNAADGSAWITDVTNATLPYTILWNTNPTQSTSLISDLSVGLYQVVVTGNDGCADSTLVNVSNIGAPTLTDSVTSVSCFGYADGAIDLTISGGTTPYTIFWSNEENTEDVSNLTAGDYYITVEDASACQSIEIITVSEPENLTFDFATTDNVCFGESNGIISLAVSGGTSPYTYAWGGGETSNVISNLSAGDYYITVTDSLACIYSTAETVSEPTILATILNFTDTVCYGTTTDITSIVSGGTFPYSYVWSNSSTLSYLSDVSVGTYYVTITDNLGCENIDSLTIYENDSMLITDITTNLTCNNDNSGAVSVTVSGGTSPYTYLWSNGSSTQIVSSLNAGTYIVTASDNNGCSVIGTYVVNEPSAFAIDDSINDVMCYGQRTGSIFINLTGGTPPYSYLWSDGNTISDTLMNVQAGDYAVTIIDSLFCSYAKTYTITQPQFPMVITSEVTQNSCYQDGIGAIDVIAFGGTTPYTYWWSDSSTTSGINKLYEGEYSVTISDAIGCADSLDFTIIGSEPLQANAKITNASCPETEDGQVDISVVNGASPYTFNWSNSEITEDIANVVSGDYLLIVTDANNCTDTLDITVANNSLSCIEIYNAFSPNEDGVNEVWNIKGIENYPSCIVNVYNQWGKNVYSSEGYDTPWDGIGTNGKALPADTYFYVIDIGNGDKPYKGSISIVK